MARSGLAAVGRSFLLIASNGLDMWQHISVHNGPLYREEVSSPRSDTALYHETQSLDGDTHHEHFQLVQRYSRRFR